MNDVILTIDDEPEILSVIDRLLTDEGYQSKTAQRGRQALEIVEKNPVDVVITDLKMPEMDGVEVLRRVKALDQNIEVIILTGYASLETAVDCLRCGAFDYLTKPLEDVDDLLDVIRRARQHREEKRKREQRLKILAQSTSDLEKQVDQLRRELAISSAARRFCGESRNVVRVSKSMLLDGSTFEIKECDALVCDELGFKPSEIIGQCLMDLLPEASAERFQTELLTKLEHAGEVYDDRLKIRRKDGTASESGFVISASHRTENEGLLIRISWHDIGKTLQAQMSEIVGRGARLADAKSDSDSDGSEGNGLVREIHHQQVERAHRTGRIEGVEIAMSKLAQHLSTIKTSAAEIRLSLFNPLSLKVLGDVTRLVNEHVDHLAEFIASDSKGGLIPHALSHVKHGMEELFEKIREESESLSDAVLRLDQELVAEAQCVKGDSDHGSS